jgi:hypothetical protein
MKVVFYASAKPREMMLAQSFAAGLRSSSDTFELRKTGDYGEDLDGNDRRFAGPDDETDVAVIFGVKGMSKQIMRDHRSMGKAVVYLDKGYTREKGPDGHTLYTRMSVNSDSPIQYMMDRKWSNDRFAALNLELEPRKENESGHVLYCSSSAKYHDFHDIGDATLCAEKVFKRLARLTKKQLVFRPKPSDRRAKAIAGVALSTASQSMQDALKGCRLVVTYGSTAAMDAVIAGIPALVLGTSIAAPVSGKEIGESLEPLYWPSEEHRYRWARAMAYCQWTVDEMRSGEAWAHVCAEIGKQLPA